MFTFRSMDTEVAVVASHHERRTARRVADTFAEAEARFSRFDPASELSALNRAEGAFVASGPLFDQLERAREYVLLTEGVFDPAVGATLRAHGYDRAFVPGALDRPRAPGAVPDGGFLEIVLERATRTVWRPHHVQIDLGGMVKGSTVDLAALHLAGDGAVDAGGDAALRGRDPDGGAWRVEIEDPRCASRTIATLAVTDASVATSAPNRRRWRLGSGSAHHLIDPRTRAPSASDLLQVTVVATTTELADVLAKTAYLLGARAGRRFLERQPDVGGVLVGAGGALAFAGALDVREVARA